MIVVQYSGRDHWLSKMQYQRSLMLHWHSDVGGDSDMCKEVFANNGGNRIG